MLKSPENAKLWMRVYKKPFENYYDLAYDAFVYFDLSEDEDLKELEELAKEVLEESK